MWYKNRFPYADRVLCRIPAKAVSKYEDRFRLEEEGSALKLVCGEAKPRIDDASSAPWNQEIYQRYQKARRGSGISPVGCLRDFSQPTRLLEASILQKTTRLGSNPRQGVGQRLHVPRGLGKWTTRPRNGIKYMKEICSSPELISRRRSTNWQELRGWTCKIEAHLLCTSDTVPHLLELSYGGIWDNGLTRSCRGSLWKGWCWNRQNEKWSRKTGPERGRHV